MLISTTSFSAIGTRNEDPLLCSCFSFGPVVKVLQLEKPQAPSDVQPGFRWALHQHLHIRGLLSSGVSNCKSMYTLGKKVVIPVSVCYCYPKAI